VVVASLNTAYTLVVVFTIITFKPIITVAAVPIAQRTAVALVVASLTCAVINIRTVRAFKSTIAPAGIRSTTVCFRAGALVAARLKVAVVNIRTIPAFKPIITAAGIRITTVCFRAGAPIVAIVLAADAVQHTLVALFDIPISAARTAGGSIPSGVAGALVGGTGSLAVAFVVAA
jgi:hypothetical protein